MMEHVWFVQPSAMLGGRSVRVRWGPKRKRRVERARRGNCIVGWLVWWEGKDSGGE